jgi:competence protein ComEA
VGLYTRAQLRLLLLVLAAASVGLGVTRWRSAHPELVDRLEQLDRDIAHGRDAVDEEPRAAADPASARERSEPGAPVPAGRRTPTRPPPPDPALPLDLNVATAAELMRLPGVGPVLARRIVETREERGRFATVDELGVVRGIGRVKVERLRPLVGVGE